MSLTGEVQSPIVKSLEFKTFDAVLNFCRFIKPDELAIRKVLNGSEVVGWQVHFTGSDGQR